MKPRQEGQGGITPADVTREVQTFARRQERRRHLLPRALLVGLLAGVVAVIFRYTLELGDRARGALFRYAHALPSWGFLIPVAVCSIGSGLAVWAVRRFAPEVAGSGIPHLKAVLHRLRSMKWQRVLLVKFASGTLGIGSGLALGREGPTIQMGGAVGQMVARWLRGTPRERQALIAAGAGAGLAAAFNAPLAGVLFVMEELRRDFSPGVLTSAFVASATADVVARYAMGQLPVFHVMGSPAPSLSSLPLFAVLGLVTGLVGVCFNRALLGSLQLFERIKSWPSASSGLIVGAAVGAIGWYLPSALGGGNQLVESTLAGNVAERALIGLLIVRFVLTMFSYGSGTAGGIFAPLLVIGAQTGLLVGILGQPYFPDAASHPTAFAVVGMGALFAAIVRAPITGIVLILEMTENYSLMLPLVLACFLAYLAADLLRDRPIYEALLERDLLRSQDQPELEATLLLDLVVQPDSKFAGRRVSDLGLPSGCLLVTIEHGLQSEVPSSDSVLRPGDRITVVIDPQAAHAVALLHEGVESVHAGGNR